MICISHHGIECSSHFAVAYHSFTQYSSHFRVVAGNVRMVKKSMIMCGLVSDVGRNWHVGQLSEELQKFFNDNLVTFHGAYTNETQQE